MGEALHASLQADRGWRSTPLFPPLYPPHPSVCSPLIQLFICLAPSHCLSGLIFHYIQGPWSSPWEGKNPQDVILCTIFQKQKGVGPVNNFRAQQTKQLPLFRIVLYIMGWATSFLSFPLFHAAHPMLQHERAFLLDPISPQLPTIWTY